jgi:hypothetical protein
MGFVWFLEETAVISFISINQLIFAGVKFVFVAKQTEFLNII